LIFDSYNKLRKILIVGTLDDIYDILSGALTTTLIPTTTDIVTTVLPTTTLALNNIEYGLLYNWYAVSDPRGLAPEGWHHPSSAEWTTIITYLGGETVAGGHLKETGTNHWTTPNTYASNSSGFTALPAGTRQDVFLPIYDYGKFRGINDDAFFTAYDEANSSFAYWLDLSYGSAWATLRNSMSKSTGFSVRCLRDTSEGWIEGEQVTDIDGHIYDTVKIGNQIWLKENLAVTHYRNGDIIPEVTGNTAWSNLTTGALCAYNNDWDNVFLPVEVVTTLPPTTTLATTTLAPTTTVATTTLAGTTTVVATTTGVVTTASPTTTPVATTTPAPTTTTLPDNILLNDDDTPILNEDGSYIYTS
jgi:uncharacterized protein (TIGR02145 family)